MSKLFKLNKRGFTLIELIITLALGLTVTVAIGSFLVRNLQYNNMAQDQVFVQDQVRNAIKGLSNLIMEKKTVSLIAGGTEGAIFNSGLSDQLEINYDAKTKELTYKIGAVKAVLARDITAFKIEKTSENLITVTIEGTKRKAKFKTVEKINLRNGVKLVTFVKARYHLFLENQYSELL